VLGYGDDPVKSSTKLDWRPKRPEGARTCSLFSWLRGCTVRCCRLAERNVDGRRLPKLVSNSRSGWCPIITYWC